MQQEQMRTSGAAPLGPDHVRAIAPYQAGKPIEELARELGLDPAGIVKLASNENPLGMSACARDAMLAEASGLHRYPDANGFALKQAVAAKHGVPASWVTLGNGSNDLLELAAMALLAPGVSCVYSQYAFTVYRLATQARGATHRVTPARDFGHDLDAMLDAVRDDTRLVFIANPNNPTGTFVPASALADFLAALRQRHGDRVAVVLDEAYTDYLRPEDRYDSLRWVEAYPNLIVTRTLSKAYGLAGLRVGYAVSQPPLTDLLNRVRQPFNVNTLAQAAAIAALADTEHLAQVYAVNLEGRQTLEEGFRAMGLRYVPSYGNFVLVQVGDAAAVNRGLLERGVIVRPVAGDGLPEWLRVSVGLPQENARCLAALADVLAGQRNGA